LLILYTKHTCPFCIRVIEFARRHGIALELRDIYKDQRYLEELLCRGGKRQIPFLLDEEAGVCMYESRDIVDYLKTRYVD